MTIRYNLDTAEKACISMGAEEALIKIFEPWVKAGYDMSCLKDIVAEKLFSNGLKEKVQEAAFGLPSKETWRYNKALDHIHNIKQYRMIFGGTLLQAKEACDKARDTLLENI